MEKTKNVKEAYLEFVKTMFPGFFIPRSEVKKVTSGLLTSKTLANLATKGDAPLGAIKIRGKVAYPVESFVDWLFPEQPSGPNPFTSN
jgi:hypothetical protein